MMRTVLTITIKMCIRDRVLNTDSSMTWILGVAVGLILIVIFVLFQVAMPKFTILQTLIDRLNLVSREILTGIPVIRAFSREKHEEERFEKANLDLTKTNLFVNRCMTFMMPIMMLIMNGVSAVSYTHLSGTYIYRTKRNNSPSSGSTDVYQAGRTSAQK